MKQKQKNISVLIIAAMVALAVFVGSAAADTTFTMDIPVTSTGESAPYDVSVPENTTKLTISADTTDNQIDIHLYDPSGEHTGATYPTGEETDIPNSTYSGWSTDPEVITVTNPAAGDYTLKAYGYYATGWANCTITMTEEVPIPPPENASYITGQVKGQDLDDTFPLLTDGVTITAIWSQNGTKYADFVDATSPDGNFSIPLPPYTTFDIKWNKVGYEEDSEERVTTLGPDETKDFGVRYLTQLEKVLVVTVDPTEVKVFEDTSVTVTVTDQGTGDLVEDATVTLSGCGVSESCITNASGQVTITIHPTSAPCDIDVTATKAGYQSGEATIEVVEKELAVVVDPDEVTKDIDTSVTATVTDKDTGDPVEDVTVTFSECGVSESGTTDASGQVTVTIHPTVAPCTITVTATKAGYKSDTTTIEVTEIPYGKLIVDVIDRDTGQNVGTFNVSDTNPDPTERKEWPVPEVNVTAWDSATNELLDWAWTVNGNATLRIPIPGGGSRVVDVNNTEVPATSNQTTSIPGITKGSELGITVLEDPASVPAMIEVTIINPPPPVTQYLEIEVVTPSTVRICEDTEVCITVIDKDTTDPVEGVTVTLEGCNVDVSDETDEDGEVCFTIHPKSSNGDIEDINVTASKTDYTDDTSTITVIDREILVVHVIDADNGSRIPEDATVELYNTTNVLFHWDTADATGTVTFNASHIDCIEDWYWIYVRMPGPPLNYRDFEEHGIWLPATEIKTKTAPLIPAI